MSLSKKPKIIIVHGWSYTLEKWRNFLTLMDQAGYECELLTVPGLTEKIDTVWKVDDYVNWLKTKLAKQENCILLGHSNGGRIILAYAQRFPEKIHSLILIDSAGIQHTDLKTQLKKSIFKILAKVGKAFTQSAKLKNLLYRLAREQDYHQASAIMKQTMTNLINFDVLPLLPNITLPVLLIWGEKDQLTPLADGQKMKKGLVNSQLFTLPTAKHSPQFTHPQETTQIIINDLPKV